MSNNNGKPVPPPRPWKKGRDGSYETVVVEVHVCRDEYGRVWTDHNLQEELDTEIALTWPSGGQEQLAFGLLTEAVRREAMLEMLILLSKDRQYVTKLLAEGEEKTAEQLNEVVKRLQVQMNRTIKLIAEAAVREAFDIAQQ